MNIEFYCPSSPRSDGEVLVEFLAKLLNELHPTLKASWQSVPVPDSLDAIDRLPPERRKHAFPLACPTTDFLLARAGGGPPKHRYNRKYTDLMFAGAITRWGWTFLTPHPELASDPRKLAGRTVGVVHGPASEHWGSPTLLSNAILRDAWGIHDRVKQVEVAVPDVGRAFAGKEVDAVFWGKADVCGGQFVTPAPFVNLLRENQYYWLPLSPADVDRINAANAWKTRLIKVPRGGVSLPGTPTGTINPPEDVAMADFCGALVAWADTEEEIVYDLLKFIADNAARFAAAKIHIAPDLESLPRFPGLTEDMVHPGARRYYREQGIKIGQ